MAASCVQDTRTGDTILKLVSRSAETMPIWIDLGAPGPVQPTATCIVLSGDPLTVNACGQPPSVLPQTGAIAVAPPFLYEVPPALVKRDQSAVQQTRVDGTFCQTGIHLYGTVEHISHRYS